MFLSLAPMDGYTDCAYRIIVKQIFDKYNKNDELLFFTEFMSADWFVNNPKGVAKHLLNTKIDQPLILQIFSWNIKSLIKTVEIVQDNYNFYWIDLNIWCPSPKIVKTGAWSGMLQNKSATLKIIEKLRKHIKSKFTIKTRIGLHKNDLGAQFDFLLKAGEICDIISLHGRSFNQWNSWEVNRDYIYEIKQKLLNKCKIIGNWGVESYEQAIKVWKWLDGVMIGQGSIWNPWCFVKEKPSIQQVFNIVLKHLDLMCWVEIYYNNPNNFDKNSNLVMPKYEDLLEIVKWLDKYNWFLKSPIEFRKHLFGYIKGLSNNKEFKQWIVKIRDYNNLVDYIKKYFEKII